MDLDSAVRGVRQLPFALDLVAFLASDEADRVSLVFGFEPALQGADAIMPARPAPKTNYARRRQGVRALEFVHELRSMNATLMWRRISDELAV